MALLGYNWGDKNKILKYIKSWKLEQIYILCDTPILRLYYLVYRKCKQCNKYITILHKIYYLLPNLLESPFLQLRLIICIIAGISLLISSHRSTVHLMLTTHFGRWNSFPKEDWKNCKDSVQKSNQKKVSVSKINICEKHLWDCQSFSMFCFKYTTDLFR